MLVTCAYRAQFAASVRHPLNDRLLDLINGLPSSHEIDRPKLGLLSLMNILPEDRELHGEMLGLIKKLRTHKGSHLFPDHVIMLRELSQIIAASSPSRSYLCTACYFYIGTNSIKVHHNSVLFPGIF